MHAAQQQSNIKEYYTHLFSVSRYTKFLTEMNEEKKEERWGVVLLLNCTHIKFKTIFLKAHRNVAAEVARLFLPSYNFHERWWFNMMMMTSQLVQKKGKNTH